MRRILFTFISFCLVINLTFAGGLVTNTNQSAAWARMLVRDASTSIEAVYHNPAGLTKLSDGFHLSLSNQSIFQDRTITNSFPYLNNPKFEGSVVAPFFPNFYAAYKTGKFAFSFGFTPIGGGGSAVFDKGVPMIEVPVSSLVANFGKYGVTGYSLTSNFEGSSVYFGVQGGISYAINDMISIYAGARYVWAKNTYKGDVKDINVITAAGSQRADAFMNGLATQARAGATQLSGAATAMTPLVAAFPAATTFDQAIAATAANPTQQAQITALRNGLIGQGATTAGSMTLGQGQATYTAYANGYTAQANQLNAGAILMGDQSADVLQTGNGFTPIVGLNLSFMEDKINIGMKYEFQTNMDLTNETPVGKGFTVGINPSTGAPIEMFPNGEVTNADIPAQLSVGLNYKATDKLSAQIGYHTYFDKQTGWKNVETEIDKDFFEIGVGLEYNITDQILVSAGYLMAQTGVNDSYQSDLSYSLSSNTFGLGGAYKINDKLTLQLGGYYTAYTSKSFPGSYLLADGVTSVAYTSKYEKNNIAFAIGMDFAFGGK
jgi:long-chain fatty acid transport protein